MVDAVSPVRVREVTEAEKVQMVFGKCMVERVWSTKGGAKSPPSSQDALCRNSATGSEQ